MANKRRNLRHQELDDEESDDDCDIGAKLAEMRTMQKLRRRQNGVNLMSLTLGQKLSAQEELSGADPFKSKSGGLIDMKALKSQRAKQADHTHDTGIVTQFSAETNKGDEDEEMLKYIAEELTKRRGQGKLEEESTSKENISYFSPEEAALQAVPDHLKVSSSQRSEEMLSNRMLSGIPEVDLGIESKIRNIVATEEAKARLLWHRRRRNESPSQFVPTNMAVNFVQHNRFSFDDAELERMKNEARGSKKSGAEHSSSNTKLKSPKADQLNSDDYYYEKFKKQFKR